MLRLLHNPISTSCSRACARRQLISDGVRAISNNTSAQRDVSATNLRKTKPKRRLSTHAIHDYSSYEHESVMINPFLRGGQQRDCDEEKNGSFAFMELFKAISVIKANPSSLPMLVGGVDENYNPSYFTPITSQRRTDVQEIHNTDSPEVATEIAESVKLNKDRADMKRKVEGAMATRRHKQVVKLFEEAVDSPTHDLIDDALLQRMVHFLSNYNLPASFEVLKYHVACSNEKGRLVKLDTYQRVIQGIYRTNLNGRDLVSLVGEIQQHIRNTFADDKKMGIVEYMMDVKFPLLQPELYEVVLTRAAYNRTGNAFLPYHEVLAGLVASGYKPKPETVMNLLKNYHPYLDTTATYEILSAIQTLQSSDTPNAADYRVDIGTLETISMNAAKRGHIDLNLLVWDLVESCGERPTECMFEDVILTFANNKSDSNSFAALVDMEKNGFVPSRALLRQLALKLSYSKGRLRHAKNILTRVEDEKRR
eukprot:g11875.t1 g11875   contig6:772723-774398(+)